jgi:hypothetical protein
MQSAGLVVRTGERSTPAWKTAVVNVRVDDHPEPLAELRQLAGLTRVYSNCNVPLERLAGGDRAGAVESARELCSRLPEDSNVRMRLGFTLAARGDPEGTEILAAMAKQSDKWLACVRGLCLRYHIDPKPIFERVRWK